MPTLTITAKGQVTLRERIFLSIWVFSPGEENQCGYAFLMAGSKWAAQPNKRQISDVFNFLRRENGPTLSIDEIDQLAAGAWAGKR